MSDVRLFFAYQEDGTCHLPTCLPKDAIDYCSQVRIDVMQRDIQEKQMPPTTQHAVSATAVALQLQSTPLRLAV